jgi:protein-L-isoaspartate(D-aspartate) O-methyltransferase
VFLSPAVTPDPSALRDALVDRLKLSGCLVSPLVEAAFRTVPRHLFLPGVAIEEVYRDQVIVTKRLDGWPVSSSSQPTIMAIMLEQLGLRPGHRVLEIGTGTGYNAALLAAILGPAGSVTSIELDEDLATAARAHLDAAGVRGVDVLCRDGAVGYPEAAPYDRIILTVGAWDLAPAWREQLRPGGRLLLPLSVRGLQRSVAFDDHGDHLASVSVHDCEFMPLRGAFAEPARRIQLGPEPGLYLTSPNPASVDPDATYGLLRGTTRSLTTDLSVTRRAIFSGFLLWLALREPAACGLLAIGDGTQRSVVPLLFGVPGQFVWTAGVLADGALAVLASPTEVAPAGSDEPASAAFLLGVRSFGTDDALAQRLLDHIHAWDRAGRPGTPGLRIRAYPLDTAYRPAPSEFVIPKRWTQLVLDWPAPPSKT